MRYDAVLFDAGETLVRPHPSFGHALHQILESLGCSFEHADVDRFARESYGHAAHEAARTGTTWSTSSDASREFWTGVYISCLASLDGSVGANHSVLAGAIYDEFTQPHRYRPFDDALPALRELKARGYRLGIISNWEAWLATLLDGLGISELVEVAVISGAEGIEKPDPRIFQLALDKMGLAPERVAYVGDSMMHDVHPPLALGMGAVLIDRHDRHPGEHRPTIASLGQLAAVLA